MLLGGPRLRARPPRTSQGSKVELPILGAAQVLLLKIDWLTGL